ncbi:MAG: glutathione S-transferase [Pseudohongiellaceae bacterium]|jgi:glutathione S-transferase
MRNSIPGPHEFRASLLAALNPMLAAEFIPKLTYLDVRERGELVRLMMAETGTSFNERRISISDWPSVKSNFTIAQLPVYEEGDTFLNDVSEIYRHVARKLKLMGTSTVERQRCERAHDLLITAQDVLFDFYWDRDFEAKRSQFEQTELVDLLNGLSRFYYSNSCDSGYWVGEGLTYIDLFAFHILDSIRPFSPGTLAQFKSLCEFKHQIETRPRIQAYLDSHSRPSLLTLPLAYFGSTEKTS